jgi:hypothetical protein
MKAAGTVLLLILSAFASTAPAQSSMHYEFLKTYDFEPHLLTTQQITEKSKALDGLWARAKANKESYVPALREELSDLHNPSFFLYDGSMLLLTLSQTAIDRKVALAAIAHCDLRDVQPNDYFHQVHKMASLNEDTTAAACHILEDPKFLVTIPQHALTLDQNYTLVYFLLPTSQEFWLQPAIDRLKIERDLTAQTSLLLVLFYSQTDAGDRAIADFAADGSRSTDSRKAASALIKRRAQSIGKVPVDSETEASLRKKRQQRMTAVSDEALYDLDDYTMKLMAKRK